MPKKIFFESSRHLFLVAAKKYISRQNHSDPDLAARFKTLIESLDFAYRQDGARRVMVLKWQKPSPGSYEFDLSNAWLYARSGDARFTPAVTAHHASVCDPVQQHNEEFYMGHVSHLAELMGSKSASSSATPNIEETFHDGWAESENMADINVRLINEACTSPELRHIHSKLGPLQGKRLLDIGAGLGECSVYFALRGARVTSVDLSGKMLECCQKLAAKYGTSLETFKCSLEDLPILPQAPFDVVYAGNVFHHVNIEQALLKIIPNMKPAGVLTSWDPVAYNPVINVYRKMASEVRTPDEHPLTVKDLKTFQKHFDTVEVRWFWLTSLLIFILFAIIGRVHPNKERYWKKVVYEADKWAWLYKPLERLDRALLFLFPFLGPLCWNVAVMASSPKALKRSAV